MTTLDDPTPAVVVDGRQGLSPAAIVALRSSGIVLPAAGDEPARPLAYADFVLLLALASRDAGTRTGARAAGLASGGEAQHLDDLLGTLLRRRLLTDAAHLRTPSAQDPIDISADLPADDAPLRILTPLQFLVTPDGFEHRDHHGHPVLRCSPAELAATAAFAGGSTIGAVRQVAMATGVLPGGALDALVVRLVGSRLLRPQAEHDAGSVAEERQAVVNRYRMEASLRLLGRNNQVVKRHDAAEARRRERTGVTRPKVWAIHHDDGAAPLGLGMIMAYAKVHDGGVLAKRYDLQPDWRAASRPTPELADGPNVLLFSNYIWSHARNMEVSDRVKAHNPACVTIHGGPDTPKYPSDVEAYFRANPHVDVAVHGEGEVTAAEALAALHGALGDGPADLSVLADVPGLSYRDGDRVVRTADRDRITDLDIIPSPYLTGVFDSYDQGGLLSMTLETSRGCPYGCTFCDWGSATLSRLRKFDLDRVFAELEWGAEHGVLGVGIADSNFGIFERDVEIAEKIAELKQTYGYPKFSNASYAKNTVKHLRKIISTWVDAGITTVGVLSLQTLDDSTLKAVKRSNIKTEKYDSLAQEFRRAKLPLYVDLMMGLPGSTYQSFLGDLQSCIEREVQAKIHPTALLPNSPMNDPAYRDEHAIHTATPLTGKISAIGDLTVVSTATLTRAEFDEMQRLRTFYLLGENFGLLRQIVRFVRHETGMREIDLYEALRRAATDEPWRWPALAWLVDTAPVFMAVPVSWQLLMDEVRTYLVEHLGLPDDSALASALVAQHALLPAPGRSFPVTIELAHDVAAWHEQAMEAKASGEDWTEVVPRLGTFGPATFTVDDPDHISDHATGYFLEASWLDMWELESPVARPHPPPAPV